MAQAEHRGWGESKRIDGWSYWRSRNDKALRHQLLRPFKDLSEADKNLDRKAIKKYPSHARFIGYRIVRVPELESPSIVGKRLQALNGNRQGHNGNPSSSVGEQLRGTQLDVVWWWSTTPSRMPTACPRFGSARFSPRTVSQFGQDGPEFVPVTQTSASAQL